MRVLWVIVMCGVVGAAVAKPWSELSPAERQQISTNNLIKYIFDAANRSDADVKAGNWTMAHADVDDVIRNIDSLKQGTVELKHSKKWISGLKYQVANKELGEDQLFANVDALRKQAVDLKAKLDREHPAKTKTTKPPPAPERDTRTKEEGGSICVKKGGFCSEDDQCCNGNFGGPFVCSEGGAGDKQTCGACLKVGQSCWSDNECCGGHFGDTSKPFCNEGHCRACWPKGHRCAQSTGCSVTCCSGTSRSKGNAEVCD